MPRDVTKQQRSTLINTEWLRGIWQVLDFITSGSTYLPIGDVKQTRLSSYV